MQVIDDYDIDIPDEMLAGVAGGRGKFLPTLLASVIMLTGAAVVSANADIIASADTTISA